jgi:hypothetical protein
VGARRHERGPHKGGLAHVPSEITCPASASRSSSCAARHLPSCHAAVGEREKRRPSTYRGLGSCLPASAPPGSRDASAVSCR